MISALNAIVDFINSVIDVVGTLISYIITFFEFIPKAVTILSDCVSFIPEELQVFCTLTIILAVVLLILGRTNSG